MVDDDLEVAVGTALVLERVLDLRDGALERREVVLAHRRRAVGVEDRLAVLEAHRRPGVDREALVLLQFFKTVINERDRLIGRGFLPRGTARLKMNSTLV